MSRSTRAIVKAKLVHDPVRLDTVWSTAFVENESLTHANQGLQFGVDGFVTPCGFPKPFGGSPVGAIASRVLLVLPAEEVIVRLLLICVRLNLAQLCDVIHTIQLVSGKLINGSQRTNWAHGPIISCNTCPQAMCKFDR